MTYTVISAVTNAHSHAGRPAILHPVSSAYATADWRTARTIASNVGSAFRASRRFARHAVARANVNENRDKERFLTETLSADAAAGWSRRAVNNYPRPCAR